MDDLMYSTGLAALALTIGAGTACLFIGYNFLSTLAGAVWRVTPENRRLAPGQVWLNLIPVFNFIWLPVTVDRVADSLHNEFYTRGMDTRDEGFGRPLGFAWLILLPLTLLLDLISSVSARNSPFPWMSGWMAFGTGVAALACWVGYWVQVAAYGRRLKTRTYAPPTTDPW